MKLEDKLRIAIDSSKISKVAEFLKNKEFNDKENYWIISSALGKAASSGGLENSDDAFEPSWD